MSLRRNPVFVAFALLAAALLIVAIGNGFGFGFAMRLAFAPYTLDLSRGIGAEQGRVIRIILGGLQLALLVLGVAATGVGNRSLRWSAAIVGIIVVIGYFALALLGFLSTLIN